MWHPFKPGKACYCGSTHKSYKLCSDILSPIWTGLVLCTWGGGLMYYHLFIYRVLVLLGSIMSIISSRPHMYASENITLDFIFFKITSRNDPRQDISHLICWQRFHYPLYPVIQVKKVLLEKRFHYSSV